LTLSGWRLVGFAFACTVLGLSLGSTLIWQRELRVIREIAEAASGRLDSAQELRAFAAKRDLAALKALRADRPDEAAVNLEDQVQDHLDFLRAQPERSEVAASVLREIEAYRKVHPWAPVLPQNPDSSAGLLATARILPVYEDGSMVGFQVSRIAPGSAWERMGLRERDIVVEVDGLKISSPGNNAKALAMLEGPTKFKAIRAGERRVALRAQTPE
jgi:hypothetical protein